MLVGLLAAAGADRLIRPWAGRTFSPVGAAEWIWSRDDLRAIETRAFYLVRDFELAAPPASARLAVQGDEEYILYLNGVRIGSNTYVDGAPLDVFEVGDFLVPGGNRLVAELRSSRGAGGFLLALQAMPDARALVATDSTWGVVRTSTPGLAAGWDRIETREPVRVWGRTPTGRWGRARLGHERPIAGHSARGVEAHPLARLQARPMRVPLDDPTLPSGSTFDFGREVTGYLRVRHEKAPEEAALLYTGTAAAPRVGVQLPVTAVLVPAGSTVWQDSVVRTVRFVRLLGWSTPPSVELMEIPPSEASRLAGAPVRGGLLGIEVPWRPTPPDHAVWHRLKERGEL